MPIARVYGLNHINHEVLQTETGCTTWTRFSRYTCSFIQVGNHARDPEQIEIFMEKFLTLGALLERREQKLGMRW